MKKKCTENQVINLLLYKKVFNIFSNRINQLTSIVLFFFILSISSTLADEPVFTGEVLKYKAMAYGVQIAEIKITTLRKLVYKKKPAVSVTASVTYRQFLDFTTDFSSILIDDDSLYVLKSSRETRAVRRNFDIQHFDYDYDSCRYYAEYVEGDNPKQIDTIKLNNCDRIWDPLALFFHARTNANINKSEVMKTQLKENEFFTTLNYSGQKFRINIDAVDYPVRTQFVTGKADWKGIYLVKGGFNVWVSDDNAKVPVLGTVETKLGVVSIELKEWERFQWAPPKFEEKEKQ